MPRATLRKVREGTVVSNKMDKTVSVRVARRIRHPIYGKIINQKKKYLAHDAENVCKEGDLVRMMEVRPLSRRKRWRIVSVLKSAAEG